MVKNTQQTLPLRASTRQNDGRPIAVVRRTGWMKSRQGVQALQGRPETLQRSYHEGLVNTGRRGRLAAVWVDAKIQKVASQPQPARLRAAHQLVANVEGAAVPGESFAQSRIQHALDLFGACMMIVAFLAFAMFA